MVADYVFGVEVECEVESLGSDCKGTSVKSPPCSSGRVISSEGLR
jgi:hypothetical protein